LLYDAKQDSIILVEQFRIGAIDDKNSPWLLEIVAGMLEDNEDPELLVKREAKEEANCDIQKLIPICNYYSSPGGTSERVYLYCGLVDSTGIGGVCGLKAEDEDILAHVVAFDDAIKLLAQGKIDNAASVIALQWLIINKQSLS